MCYLTSEGSESQCTLQQTKFAENQNRALVRNAVSSGERVTNSERGKVAMIIDMILTSVTIAVPTITLAWLYGGIQWWHPVVSIIAVCVLDWIEERSEKKLGKSGHIPAAHSRPEMAPLAITMIPEMLIAIGVILGGLVILLSDINWETEGALTLVGNAAPVPFVKAILIMFGLRSLAKVPIIIGAAFAVVNFVCPIMSVKLFNEARSRILTAFEPDGINKKTLMEGILKTIGACLAIGATIYIYWNSSRYLLISNFTNYCYASEYDGSIPDVFQILKLHPEELSVKLISNLSAVWLAIHFVWAAIGEVMMSKFANYSYNYSLRGNHLVRSIRTAIAEPVGEIYSAIAERQGWSLFRGGGNSRNNEKSSIEILPRSAPSKVPVSDTLKVAETAIEPEKSATPSQPTLECDVGTEERRYPVIGAPGLSVTMAQAISHGMSVIEEDGNVCIRLLDKKGA